MGGAGGDLADQGRADHFQRMAHGRGGDARDAARRAVPGDDGRAGDERGDGGDPAVGAAGLLAGVSGCGAAGGIAGWESAGDLAARGGEAYSGVTFAIEE